MSRLVVVPIVEGHGEDAAIRLLLNRIWIEVVRGEYLDVLKPIRAKRNKLVQAAELGRLIELAALKLQDRQGDDRRLIFVLVDADKDAPDELRQRLADTARASHPHLDIFCAVANVEYETWFVASAESLVDYLILAESDPPSDPEAAAAGKCWIASRFKGTKYSETVDQPAMTAKMDLELCRSRSKSFDLLCRELERRR